MNVRESFNSNGKPQSPFIWENLPQFTPDMKDRQRKYWGTLVLDVDGTLTRPNSDYAIEPEAIRVPGKFLRGGGNLILCTGATTGRIERSFLTSLFSEIHGSDDIQGAKQMFERVFVLPENGSVLLINKEIYVEENELRFRWLRLHGLHVPDKASLRKVLEKELVRRLNGSYIAGDDPRDRVQREYMMSLKGVKDTMELKRFIEKELTQKYPDIDWSHIAIKAARTTIDFVHVDSGKTISVAWVLKEIENCCGPVAGFGDLGDEFANVVPTFNVNKNNPNAFRERGIAAMDLTGEWHLLYQNGYVIVGEDPNTRVLDRKTGKEIMVLRTDNRKVLYAAPMENGFLNPTDPDKGHPVEIKPLTYVKDEKTVEIENAGRGTAWIIERLLEKGYFDNPFQQT